MKVEEVKNVIMLKGQHTIQHVQIQPNQIGEKGITLEIEKVKSHERKLSDEVMGRPYLHDLHMLRKKKSSLSVKGLVFYISLISCRMQFFIGNIFTKY